MRESRSFAPAALRMTASLAFGKEKGRNPLPFPSFNVPSGAVILSERAARARSEGPVVVRARAQDLAKDLLSDRRSTLTHGAVLTPPLQIPLHLRPPVPQETLVGVSKSRFTSGLQCHKKLWWEVHEPGAVELQPDKVLQDLFDQGRLVGQAARTRYPDGVLIDLPYNAYAERIAATKDALASGAPAVFEATFSADGITVAVDVLEKQGDGYRLTEVKASNSQKPEHIPDVAVQARVAAASGVNVTAAEVLHLNREFRHPDTGELFTSTGVTEQVIAFLPQVQPEIDRQRAMLVGPLPDVPIGEHWSRSVGA